MIKNKKYLLRRLLKVVMTGIIIFIVFSCTYNPSIKKIGITSDSPVSKKEFLSVPDSVKPWVYYWWLKGNVTEKSITKDLEAMKTEGFGGFLLFDSRGYWDDYYGRTGHIPVPLKIKHEFMSPGWREMVKFAMQESNRLGLKMSINLANTGGSLRGPWNMKEDRPKQLIWTSANVSGPSKISVKPEMPSDKNYFHDVALMAVKIKSGIVSFSEGEKKINLNGEWKTILQPSKDAPVAEEIVDLKSKMDNGILNWNVPKGEWRILRFGYEVIGEEGSVDILNAEAVTKYYHLMGSELLKDAGPLAGVTLTHFYNVSWEGGQPDWTVDFEKYFKKYRGYDIRSFMPVLTGMSAENSFENKRFMRDYLRTVSDCFKHNCYETMGALCHANGILWHSEDGGPWNTNTLLFKEADQLTFWGQNDMPQGEFWCSNMKDLGTKSNVRYAAMAGHIYGHPLIAVEAFTHMGRHWTKYPAYLKPFADLNFVDGANFFFWHTFTASPIEVGKPGYEYFAGTHINTNVTWWKQAGSFIKYLGRCQYLLRNGKFVADVCCYVSDKNNVTWGRGKKWNPGSSLVLPKGYKYDLLSSDVLTERLSVKDGKLVLPNGRSYDMLVVDLIEPTIPAEVINRIKELAKEGATIVFGKCKPLREPGLNKYSNNDKKIVSLADELWMDRTKQIPSRNIGKGNIYCGTDMSEIMKSRAILPDFEGPFKYIHRNNNKQDIYFISGEGNSDCIFRIYGKKPEIWDPVSGQVCDAVSYSFTDDGRTIVPVNLPKNGSVFVVFKEKADNNHIVSVEGPVKPEVVTGNESSSKFAFWESGVYKFSMSKGSTKKVSVSVKPSYKITGPWNVTFYPATGAGIIKKTINKLTLWNENSDPEIKYFAGTASYKKIFTLTAAQANNNIACLQLGKVYDISEVWVNGRNLGVVWTYPWSANLSGVLREGANDLTIEVTNCWANRLIGDAGLPESKWTTKTTVRRVPNRKKYTKDHQAFSALDSLYSSGFEGPVFVKFGEIKDIGK